jgi:hypothetical protein
MSDEELKFPEWQAPLQELILEFDREKWLEKLRSMEAVIFERLQQLGKGRDGRDEQVALRDALSVMRIIKQDRLGFPDWK